MQNVAGAILGSGGKVTQQQGTQTATVNTSNQQPSVGVTEPGQQAEQVVPQQAVLQQGDQTATAIATTPKAEESKKGLLSGIVENVKKSGFWSNQKCRRFC